MAYDTPSRRICIPGIGAVQNKLLTKPFVIVKFKQLLRMDMLKNSSKSRTEIHQVEGARQAHWQKLRIACVETQRIYPTTLKAVLLDCGLRAFHLEDSRALDRKANKLDVLIFAESLSIGSNGFLVGSQSGRRVRDFVRRGGICWVMRQARHGFDLSWLPEALRDTEPDYFYRRALGDEYPEQDPTYLCPWVMDRDHPIWSHPHQVDESDFVGWRIDNQFGRFKTAATHALRQSHWRILARHTDSETLYDDNVALVAEYAYGKGLYLWTEIYPPQAVWHQKRGIERSTWHKWLNNILTYFANRKASRSHTLHVRVDKQSVLSGEAVEVCIDGANPPGAAVRLTAEHGDGKTQKLSVKKCRGAWVAVLEPRAGGLCRLTAELADRRGACATARQAVRVTQGYTPVRFTIHTHYHLDWAPYSLGYLRGLYKRMGIDVCVLANSKSYHIRWRPTTAAEIAAADGAEVRFIPGMEIHSHIQYGPEDGSPRGSDDKRRHVTVIGNCNIDHDNWMWQPELMSEIHHDGLAIVSHPGPMRWNRQPQAGHHFDGTEIANITPDNLHWCLRQHPPRFAMHGIDLWWTPDHIANQVNVLWMNEPLSYQTFLGALLQGRVTFAGSRAAPRRLIKEFLWFDIDRQPAGGRVYATDRVQIHISHRGDRVIPYMRLIQNGRVLEKIEINARRSQQTLDQPIEGSCYFRVESDVPLPEKGALPIHYEGYEFSNPVYVRKVPGPPGASFSFVLPSNAKYVPALGRWNAACESVEQVSWRGDRWRVKVHLPDAGLICFSRLAIKSISINARSIEPVASADGRRVYKIPGGASELSVTVEQGAAPGI